MKANSKSSMSFLIIVFILLNFSIKEILAATPKQKRTGLFSATQAKERADLTLFALRNPKTIKLKETSNVVCPVALHNFYTVRKFGRLMSFFQVCNAAEKLMAVVEFIRSKPESKILVFFPSCSGVRYFKSVTLFSNIVTYAPDSGTCYNEATSSCCPWKKYSEAKN